MTNDNKFFEDFYKVAGSAMNTAFGTMADMKKQFEDMVNTQIESILAKYGFVKREEFEIAMKMVQKSREEQEKLKQKLAELENRLNN